jgi:hypothetical protein
MKRVYILVNVLISTATFAQPTLEQSNVGEVLGNNYMSSITDWDGVISSGGANQTWDYSNIITTSTSSLDYVDPSTCPSAGSFVNANVSAFYDNQSYIHLNVTATDNDVVGQYASGVPIPYSDPEKVLKYPFTMGDSYVDSFGGTFYNGTTFVRDGNVTVTADGYGTLILPNSTITNVLRVKVTEDYGDAVGGVEVYHYNIDIYKFYKPGINTPVLTLTHIEYGTVVINHGAFIDDPSLEIEESSTEELLVYPNPFTNKFTVETSTNDESIEVFDILGNLISYTKVSEQNKLVIDLNDNESGIYIVRVTSATEVREMKLIKE